MVSIRIQRGGCAQRWVHGCTRGGLVFVMVGVLVTLAILSEESLLVVVGVLIAVNVLTAVGVCICVW